MNRTGIVEALCNTCRVLVLNHNAKRAQPVAIEAVRQARYVCVDKQMYECLWTLKLNNL